MTKNSKKPLFRKCIGCNEIKNRAEMLRIMKLYTTGEVILNPKPIHFGRSAYICCNIDCVNIMIKKKKLQKSLRKEVPQDLIQRIIQSITITNSRF